MIHRLLTLCFITAFAFLGVWQVSRRAWGWVAFDLVLVLVGVWCLLESIIDEVKRAK